MQHILQIYKNKPESGLYIVAVPIGNLGDITMRSLELLHYADLVLCEDTRVTDRLLKHYGLKKKLYIYNEQSDKKMRQFTSDKIAAGNIVALVSDAGTPLISDPGYKLVKYIKEQGFFVTSLPGPCAALTALTISTLPSHKFMFEGFLPTSAGALQQFFVEIKNVKTTIIAYERASRLNKTLEIALEVLGDRRMCVARELTKKFEEVKTGKISDLLLEYKENGGPKGEVVVLIEPVKKDTYDEDRLDCELKTRLEKMPLKQAVSELSEITGINKKQLYQQALCLKNQT